MYCLCKVELFLSLIVQVVRQIIATNVGIFFNVGNMASYFSAPEMCLLN